MVVNDLDRNHRMTGTQMAKSKVEFKAGQLLEGNEPNPIARLVIVALLYAWSIALFVSVIASRGGLNENYNLTLIGRLGSSAFLVFAGVAWFVAAGALRDAGQRLIARRYSAAIAVGMTLGFIGDVFNAGLIPIPEPVMGGIVSFGLGHIAYIYGCIWLGNRLGLNRPAARYGALLFWEIVGLAGWAWVMMPLKEWNVVHLAALPYTLLLAGTTGCCAGLMLQDSRFTRLTLGAALFFVSDLILAFRLFHGEFKWGGDAVWLTYGPGQMLIVFSVGSVLAVLREPKR
ncbi:MAG: lysoplasmalogenase [Planctomycetota bacterium]